MAFRYDLENKMLSSEIDDKEGGLIILQVEIQGSLSDYELLWH